MKPRYKNTPADQIFKDFYEFNIIQKKLKFRYKIVKPMVNFPSKSYVNGSWIGILGQLANKTADIYPSYTAITHKRQEVMDFSSLIGMYTINFFIKRIEIRPGWNAIFKSFSIQVSV
ncbi:glutamate receptor ionotropic, delta-1-like [Centruroides sculpturatus]|uniref:glutamate receptor ionotropic, delta-1-like n=1 Tax=Centruroides sculpturatus TaxID=218467 RepID=UPI000C6DEA40|nr:glutamate receptor ionotropic, delta-1-like [Centruroides sculpturatus]